jgi:hypothetical protein
VSLLVKLLRSKVGIISRRPSKALSDFKPNMQSESLLVIVLSFFIFFIFYFFYFQSFLHGLWSNKANFCRLHEVTLINWDIYVP